MDQPGVTPAALATEEMESFSLPASILSMTLLSASAVFGRERPLDGSVDLLAIHSLLKLLVIRRQPKTIDHVEGDLQVALCTLFHCRPCVLNFH